MAMSMHRPAEKNRALVKIGVLLLLSYMAKDFSYLRDFQVLEKKQKQKYVSLNPIQAKKINSFPFVTSSDAGISPQNFLAFFNGYEHAQAS